MSKGRARIAISQGLGVWVLEAPHGFGDAHVHSHHAIQITISLSGGLRLTADEQTLAAPVVAVAADVRHRFEAHGLLAFVFVEPESPTGRALSQMLFNGRPLVTIDEPAFARSLEPLRSTFDAGLTQAAMLETGQAAVRELASTKFSGVPDDRIQRIIDQVTSHPEQPLDQAAESAGVYLSHSRLRHLFVEQTGLAFKTYMLWLRLVKAVQLYSDGLSLTEAAHSAGFADSAHFSRAFKRTFGLPATTLTRQ